jgi:hypothetical protein
MNGSSATSNASRGARAKFLPPRGIGAASYIELFSGSGRSLIRDTDRIIDGSPLVAFKAAKDSGALFSEIHLNDFDPEKANAVKQRIHAAATIISGHPTPVRSFDHLVGAQKESFRDREANRFGSLEVDHQREPSRLLNRQITGCGSPQHLVGEASNKPIHQKNPWPVAE